MEAYFLLIPLSFLLFIILLGLLIWSLKSGQFDDLKTPKIRILTDSTTEDEDGKISLRR